MDVNKIINGDCLEVLKTLPDECVNCCITSPPYYGLRDYGVSGQIGLEVTPEEYVQKLVVVFHEVRRVLRADGTLWMNLGDSYNAAGRIGHGSREGWKQGTNRASACGEDTSRPSVDWLKPKDLIGIPWMVAFALRADGWYLRQDIIWHKPNPMPESVRDRCTKAHEYVFLMSKSERYYFDGDAIAEPCLGDNLPGNTKHKYTDAYNDGAKEHRTKSGLVAYAQKRRDSWKGSQFGKGKTATHQLGRTQSEESRAARKHDGTGSGSDGSKIKDHCGCSMNREDGMRNRRSVWSITTQPVKEAHFATFPTKLIEPMIKAGCPIGGIVLDPFIGSGTTGRVSRELQRNYIGIELNQKYISDIASKRTTNIQQALIV